MPYDVYNRIDEQGRFLGAVYYPSVNGGSQQDTHSFSVLYCHEVVLPHGRRVFSGLEMLARMPIDVRDWEGEK